MPSNEVINGKTYPMWSRFVEEKAKWIGGTLEEVRECMGPAHNERPSTRIVDITLTPNGVDSAMFSVVGEEWDCASDVQFLSVDPAACEDGWLGFGGYGGHMWRIKGS